MRYRELANAIIEKAAEDYRDVLRTLKRFPEDRMAQGQKEEIERFFHSDWFGVLTDVNPDYILDAISKEVRS